MFLFDVNKIWQEAIEEAWMEERNRKHFQLAAKPKEYLKYNF